VTTLPHKLSPLLTRLQRIGPPVVLATDPWNKTLLNKCFQRGPHKSAHEYAHFLQDEFLEFVQKGFGMLLPYDEEKNIPGLGVSPIGVVPQKERQPRIIVDYSQFLQYQRQNNKISSHRKHAIWKGERMTVANNYDGEPKSWTAAHVQN
jgi:hypothetical protein